MSDGRDDYTGWRGTRFYLYGRFTGEVLLYRGYVRGGDAYIPPGLHWCHRDFTTTARARAWVEQEARLSEIAELA